MPPENPQPRTNSTLRTLVSRTAALFRRRRLDADLDEELRAHITLAIEDNLRRGLTRQQARTAALRSFGGVSQAKEIYRSQRGLPWLEQLMRDARYGCRQLLRAPGFTLTAVFTLALGLGANTAVFSLINALLLRPLPVPHSEELAVLHYLRSDDSGPNYSFSFPLLRSIEKNHEAFQSVAGFSSTVFQVRENSGSVRVPGALVSGQYFQVLETPPLLGRYLTPQDDHPGGSGTEFPVVLSENYWRTQFNSAADVVGRKIVIANTPFIIVGVMPHSFIGADPTRRANIYAPLWAEPVTDAPYNSIANGYHSWWFRVIARRNPGISLEQGNAALQTESSAVLREVTDAQWAKDAQKNHFLLTADPGSKGFSHLRTTFVKPLSAIFALCAAMLLLACLNLASLLMARAAARERELATRLALGASRRCLIQQLMVESLLVAILGTAAGIVAAPVVSRSLAVMILDRSPESALDTTLDLRVFAFVAMTAIFATLLIGLVPALRATSKNLNEQIKTGAHTVSTQPGKRLLPRLLPRLLMAFEVALALILVFGAALLATSLTRLYRTGLGFDPKGIVNIEFDMGKQPLDGDALVRWYQNYGDALRHKPGVENVSFADITPMNGSMWTSDYHTPVSGGDREIYMNTVSPDFFASP